jgi:hypothetical protein
MPAALLLLLCAACNRAPKEASYKTPAAAPPAASNLTLSAASDAEADKTGLLSRTLDNADTTRAVANFTPPQITQQAMLNQANTPVPAANPDWEKKIIKTADLSIEVKSFSAFTRRLHDAVHQSGGYISQEQQDQSSSSIENTVTIKIPVDRFDDLLTRLPADSDKLMEKKVSSEDVTMEVIDTKSRLETKKEVRERYLGLLKQARNMKDILAIQEEIDGIQEEMDAASGRIAYLGHSATFSTINLKFYQLLDGGAADDTPPTFLHKIKLSWLAGWDWCGSVALGLFSVWPLWLAAGLGWWGWRRHRARFTKTPAATRA